MNYEKHYNLLINRAKTRSISGYTEKHHIIPKCMGGNDDASNLVELTAEEHYIAHLLLVKMYPNKGKLIYAANMMTVDAHGGRSTNKRYKWVKEKWIEQLRKDATGRKASEETRAKISKRVAGKGNPMYGRKGANHPSFGIKPWRNQITIKSIVDWRYSLVIYDYYVQDSQFNPFNKKVGHKRIVKDLGIPNSCPIRSAIEKITSTNWNPYNEPDLIVWMEELGLERPNLDLSEFRFPKAFKYSYAIYDWFASKSRTPGRGTKFTSFYKECPELKDISGIRNSHIIYILEHLIQKEHWNPYEDVDLQVWIQKWHS